MGRYIIKNVPTRIFLQPLCEDYIEELKDEEDEEEIIDFNSLNEITWCREKLFSYDIEYVRKDLYDNLLKEFIKLKKER